MSWGVLVSSRAALILLLAAGLGGGAVAQEQVADFEVQEPEVPVFGETINVRVVNVDVWVTDKKGNPVSGLTVDDFEIQENKRPVAITNFYEYVDRLEVGLEVETELEPVPDRPRRREDLFTSHPGLRTSSVPANQRLSLMLYIDHFNLTPIDRNRVFRYLRQFLRTKLSRDDRVMLVTYNRPPIKVIRPFTSDAGLIADATYELEKHTGGRSQTNSERMDIIRAMGRDRVDYYRMLGRVRLYAENVMNDLQFTLDGLREAVTMMAGLPGRKAILYVSDGLPMRAAEDLFWALDERFRNDDQAGQASSSAVMDIFQFDSSRRFDDVSSLANANRVTFYTIDAAGLRVGGMRSAEFEGTQFSTGIDQIHTNNLQDSIMYMADRTGGTSIVNTNNILAGLDKVASDFENRYSLGYAPGHGGTARRYKIKVDLKKDTRKRYKQKLLVRHRDSYLDKPIQQEMGDATFASLTMGFETNPLGIRVEADPGPDGQLRREDGNFMVTVLVRIPIASVTLVPVGAEFQPRVTLYVQVLDKKGKTSPVSEQVMHLKRIKAEDLERVLVEGFWTYELKLLMEPGEQKIAIGVRDDLNAEVSLLTRFVDVGR